MARRISGKIILPISKVVIDESLYPRKSAYWQTSYVYSENIRAGAIFPPIVVAKRKNEYVLVDGRHRLEARKLLKQEEIEAIVHSGWDDRMIFTEAVRANVSHGQKLSPFELRNIALKLRNWGVAQGEISELTSIPVDKLESFVGTRLVNSITGKVIVEEVLKSGVKHLAGQNISSDRLGVVQSVQDHLSISNQLVLFDQLISLFESGLVDLSDVRIAARVESLRSLLDT